MKEHLLPIRAKTSGFNRLEVIREKQKHESIGIQVSPKEDNTPNVPMVRTIETLESNERKSI